MDDIAFLRAAQDHGYALGPVARQQLGITRRQLDRIRRADDVERPHRGVVLLPGPEDRSLRRIRAAVAAIQGPVAVTGWSAAYLLGLATSAPTQTHLLVPHGSGLKRRQHLLITESSTFPEAGQRSDQSGLPVVRSARMLCDLSPKTDQDRLLNLAIDARFADLLGVRDLGKELQLRRRFPGRARIRWLAEQLCEDGSDSGFEYRAKDRFISGGLVPIAQQFPLPVGARTRYTDLLFPGQVAVECLGLKAHSGRRAFDSDAERRNDLAEIDGLLVYELTWTTFLNGWDAFVERVARSVERRTSF